MKPPFALKPKDVEISPGRDGIDVAFSTEYAKLHPEVHARLGGLLERAFGRRKIDIRSEGQGPHRVHIAGLGANQAGQVSQVMDMLHLIHTDGDDCPDVCMALGWQTSPEGQTKAGQFASLGKQEADPDRIRFAVNKLHTVILAHNELNASAHVVAPPSGSGFAGGLARGLGEKLGVPVLATAKAGGVSSQYWAGNLPFEELCERRRGTITVRADGLSGGVLIVDDIFGSGGTLRELTRYLRSLGAERIFALTVTKNLRHHRKT